LTKGTFYFVLKIGEDIIESPDWITHNYSAVSPKIHDKKIMIPLKEVAENLGCTVNVNAKTQTATINLSGEILVPKLADTSQSVVENWAKVSSVHQFLYKNEGFAYAYGYDGKLTIHTPSHQLNIEMKYPLLGDVLSDDEGNFYVVWGKEGQANTDETIWISKYSQTGEHLNTTGFKGESVMGVDGNTKIPFDAGNCTSAIANGQLMVNYAREMYSGHQSNNVISKWGASHPTRVTVTCRIASSVVPPSPTTTRDVNFKNYLFYVSNELTSSQLLCGLDSLLKIESKRVPLYLLLIPENYQV